MDFHIVVIIACVFLVSLFSLLFINKIFRRKTFEEIVAEKKALTEKIYGPAKTAKKQARIKAPSKKELKKEKRQRQQKKTEDNTTELDDSDGQSENASVEDSPRPEEQEKSNKKATIQPAPVHVEFTSEPEIVDSDNGSSAGQRRLSADSNNQKTNKSNKQRKNANAKSGGGSILINKNEPVLVKETITSEDEVPLNHFESKPPKDVIELKKSENLEIKKPKEARKFNKNQPKKENQPPIESNEVLSVAKELKQLDEKPVRVGSPKNQNNKINKQQNKKKNDKDNVLLDKINEIDAIDVNLLMNLFGRSELNRGEIQILIDYLLNKQQDMPVSHSEWSDDKVQKLKKQLEEKEKALHEEQEASAGIQAKLRELRAEINTERAQIVAERAQMAANIKSFNEELEIRKSEIAALRQEIQAINEKFAAERQQFQNKLRLEKQAGSQDVLLQLQRENERSSMLQAELLHKEQAINELSTELVHKEQCLNELNHLLTASQQGTEEAKQKSNEIVQTQVNQIHVLEQKLDEAEVLINEHRYALDKAKTVESELESNKVELRNLQNALDSQQAELDLARNELGDKQQEINTLNLQKQELIEEIQSIRGKVSEQSKEQGDLQNTLDILQTTLDEKEKKLAEYETSLKLRASKEDELIKQLQEQKDKNNDLRTKNWKLVDALEAAETAKKQISNSLVQQQQQQALLLSEQQQQKIAAPPPQQTQQSSTDPAKDQKQIRDILERLYPDAVKANAGSALTLSFDQWIEQVLATHVKQSISKSSATTSTTTTSTNTNTTNTPTTNSNSSSNHTSHNHNNLNSSEETKNSSVSINSSSSVCSSGSGSDVETTSSAVATADKAEINNLKSENAQLRAKTDELTKLVTKTENTLLRLEADARAQEELWQNILHKKELEINLLKHSNGKQDI